MLIVFDDILNQVIVYKVQSASEVLALKKLVV